MLEDASASIRAMPSTPVRDPCGMTSSNSRQKARKPSMPEWLRAVAGVNPLTYLVDALRMLMIAGGQGAHGLVVNFAVLGGVFIVFVVIAARLYPTLIE